MSETDAPAHDDGLIQIRLVGGPKDIPAAQRVLRVRPGEQKVKLPHIGGYEHFECHSNLPSERGGSAELSTYHWTSRTKIAE